MNSIFHVAWYILNECGSMTTMKLQKMCFYCQAWSLAWDGKPLFDEDFEAWANGPVSPALFAKHKGLFVVDESDFSKYEKASFSPEGIETMDEVIESYKDKTPQWLSDLTHNESPWKNARKGYKPGASCSVVIEKEDMQQYYGGL